MNTAIGYLRLLPLALGLLYGQAATAQAQNGFQPGAIWPDANGVHINAHGGGIVQHQGIYYWFGEHKLEGTAGNRAQVGVHVYSSRNLSDWRDEGIALAVSADPMSEIVKGSIIERPKVIYNAHTGKFVMWFHLERKRIIPCTSRGCPPITCVRPANMRA
jgi:hypothetical protein